jgi:hypothetical protein
MISRNKYRAIRTNVDGKTFHSKKEARRYVALKLLEKSGDISGLLCQPKITLLVNGVAIGKYIADFRYLDKSGKEIIEDVKSPASKTPLYKLKKKILSTYNPPIDILET